MLYTFDKYPVNPKFCLNLESRSKLRGLSPVCRSGMQVEPYRFYYFTYNLCFRRRVFLYFANFCPIPIVPVFEGQREASEDDAYENDEEYAADIVNTNTVGLIVIHVAALFHGIVLPPPVLQLFQSPLVQEYKNPKRNQFEVSHLK